ncbi:allophanate hydrolase [Sneathiella sp. DP05]|uniref:Allophanate hydrolase n=1 Tax=Sneathiella litorea TaxID=2606216 RepID=A0A6L8WAZ4_9PROT|nr:allophanate hydrolase [Sneathiella litorea]
MFSELVPDGWKDCIFEPFQPGVEICWLLKGEPGIALLKYAPGAQVPRHRHAGLETILVLDGSQSDVNGHYTKGTYVANPDGSEHAVWSDEGCVVLIQWQQPVVFVDEPVVISKSSNADD